MDTADVASGQVRFFFYNDLRFFFYNDLQIYLIIKIGNGEWFRTSLATNEIEQVITYSETTIFFASALNPIFACVPSQ